MKGKTWITGAVAALAAGAFLAVSQPAILSATANQGQVSTVTQEKGFFGQGHRGGIMGGPGFKGGFGGRMGLGIGAAMDAVSKLLGMEQADLMKELQAGKTLVEIAKAKGVSEDKLVATVKAEIKSAIDEKVKEGILTEDQAKELESRLDEDHIKTDLNRVPPAGGKGFGGRMGLGIGAAMDAVSKLLGMEQADLVKELQAGKTLVEIAKAKGISEEKLVETVKAEIKSAIDEKVKEGILTEDQAKELESRLDEDHIKADLNRVPPAGGKGFGFGGRGRHWGPEGL